MSGVLVAGHQPHYLPWLGYVDKIAQVDVFCLMDCIPFDEKLYQHRNRIRSRDGEQWLVVPVRSEASTPPLLQDLEIEESTWAQDHWRAIRDTYGSAPHFRAYAPWFEDLYSRRWEKLTDLDAFMIQGLIDSLALETRLVRASELGVSEANGRNLHVQVCEKLGAERYMSGAGGGCSHLDEQALGEAGIEHIRQQFAHPIYPQIHGDFVKALAAVDLLFNCGPRAGDILKGRA